MLNVTVIGIRSLKYILNIKNYNSVTAHAYDASSFVLKIAKTLNCDFQTVR